MHWSVLVGLMLTTSGETIRVGTWNTANRPNNANQSDAFSLVFDAVGPFDLLALTETDGGSAGLLPGLTPFDDSSVVVSGRDSGGDRTGFLYRESSLRLKGFTDFNSAGLTHRIAVGLFETLTPGSDEFYAASVHLNSGDETRRASDAEIVRTLIRELADETHVIVMGDFNLDGTEEVPWQTLTAAGLGQLFDVAGVPGTWHRNPEVSQLFTQDTGRGMDDRFDLILVTESLLDGQFSEYAADSIEVIGGDLPRVGFGPLLGIESDPFRNASDHLPVMATFEIATFAAGDANRDGRFNQRDLVEVLIAGKYSAAKIADWRDGDWNADGLFDVKDLVVALQTGSYASDHAQSVPQPNTFTLLAIFTFFLAMLCHRY